MPGQSLPPSATLGACLPFWMRFRVSRTNAGQPHQLHLGQPGHAPLRQDRPGYGDLQRFRRRIIAVGIARRQGNLCNVACQPTKFGLRNNDKTLPSQRDGLNSTGKRQLRGKLLLSEVLPSNPQDTFPQPKQQNENPCLTVFRKCPHVANPSPAKTASTSWAVALRRMLAPSRPLIRLESYPSQVVQANQVPKLMLDYARQIYSIEHPRVDRPQLVRIADPCEFFVLGGHGTDKPVVTCHILVERKAYCFPLGPDTNPEGTTKPAASVCPRRNCGRNHPRHWMDTSRALRCRIAGWCNAGGHINADRRVDRRSSQAEVQSRCQCLTPRLTLLARRATNGMRLARNCRGLKTFRGQDGR